MSRDASKSTAAWRILVADGRDILRAGLRSLIAGQPDLTVAAEAGDGESACRLAAELSPDVAVIDAAMPAAGGEAAAERILRECPGVRVLALTAGDDVGQLRQLVLAGASGGLSKRATAEALIDAVRAVALGGFYLGGDERRRLLGFATGDRSRGSLSLREEEVLRSVARGYGAREIAARLGVSIKTVETHKQRSMKKLGLANRVEVIDYAVQQGWLSDG